ncbi:Chromodomain-helicase-DNA-binding protein 1-like [Mactra antiquata]
MSDIDSEPGGSLEENSKKQEVSLSDLKKVGWGDIELRPYQLVGVNWMIERFNNGFGCILGDEMGLGKTCQTIAVIAYINNKCKKKLPNLVVCPRSVLENWEQEISRFAPGLRKQILIGEKEKRQDLAKNIKSDYKKGNLKFDVLVTTYEICLKDSTFLRSIPWNLLVIDEAHRLKNMDSLLHRTLVEWDTHTSILLTGTPVQNNLQELYALLSFICPKKFPADEYEDFVNRFSSVEKSDKKSKELHKLLKPFLLLRRKTEVLKDLPEKTEVVLTHGISKLQAKLYKGILVKDTDVFETGTGSTKHSTKLMNILMQLRKCVNHPYLFDGVEPEPFILGEHLVESSGKLILIDKLLKYLYNTGHKVLMFSQMTHMLDVLQDYLGYRGYTYERLDGSVRGEERFLAVQNFNANDETFVFLLSTRAGGQGINLTSADTVIFVDSDFNPQNDLQAAARAHRIGQSRPVKIIRLIGHNTVEEIILKRAEDKLKLTSAVIKEGEFSLGANKQALFADDKVKLQDILKYGVDELLSGKHDDDDYQIDFKFVLGPTINGEWQPDEDDESQGDTGAVSSAEDEGVMDDAPQSMYVFEGTDYSKQPTAADVKAFEELLETQKAVVEEALSEDRPSRMKREPTSFMAGLPELRKPRQKMSPEELEERRIKRKEAADKRAKEAEEKEMRKAQEARKRRDELWKKNDYKSLNIEIDENADDEDEDDDDIVCDEEESGETTQRDIHYVYGDVTKPKKTDRDVNIVVHCADDSGGWGKGGIFSALSARSSIPHDHYTLAGNMQDLALGDCHLIPLDDGSSMNDVTDYLGLIIAQHRDKRNNLSGIKLSALRYGLEKVYVKAKEYKASVHLPRIGHDTAGFNWYGTEKLIKKHLASKGIPTYIYYYPRKQQKRKPVVTFADTPPSKVKKPNDDTKPTTSSTSRNNKSLLDIFTDTVIFLHNNQMSDEDIKRYKRYIIAYNGDIDSTISDQTTHIVISEHCDTQTISSILKDQEDSSIKVVTSDWIDDSLKHSKLMKTINYEIN